MIRASTSRFPLRQRRAASTISASRRKTAPSWRTFACGLRRLTSRLRSKRACLAATPGATNTGPSIPRALHGNLSTRSIPCRSTERTNALNLRRQRALAAVLAENRAGEPPRKAGDECSAGYRQDPRPDDGARDAPSHRRDVLGRAHADDRARDGVSRRNGDAERRGGKERNAAGGFRAKPADGPQFRNPLSHRLDDAPAAERRAEPDRDVADRNHPVGNRFLGMQMSRRNQKHPDDAGRLLSIVAAMPQAVKRR